MTLRSMGALAALALGIAACQPQAAVAPLSEDDRAAITGVQDKYRQATLSGDAAAVAALYTEDGVRMPPNAAPDQGRAAIHAALQADPGTVTSFTITTAEMDGVDGLAYDRGSYSITVSVEGRPQPITDNGKYLVILEKQLDGSWLISSLIWNSDQALPGM